MTIANITWLTKNVATGGDFSFNAARATAQFFDLLDMHLSLVIDCRKEADDYATWHDVESVKYIHLPTDDAYGHTIPRAHFDAAVKAARKALENGGRVFAHCHMGINRGPSTAMAILMDQGFSPERAFDRIRARRPIAGIVYAEDAIEAHFARKGWSEERIWNRVVKFTEHRNLVYPLQEQRRVQHIIRNMHEVDHDERINA